MYVRARGSTASPTTRVVMVVGSAIAAGGDVGSRFPVARSVDDGASATGVCKQNVYHIRVLKMIAMLRLFFTAHRGICACGWGRGDGESASGSSVDVNEGCDR